MSERIHRISSMVEQRKLTIMMDRVLDKRCDRFCFASCNLAHKRRFS
jgi:hypothetical protein